MNKIPAPISEKEVMPDMLCNAIFDSQYIDHDGIVLGFIQNKPYVLRYGYKCNVFSLEGIGHDESVAKYIEDNINSSGELCCEVDDYGNECVVRLFYAE
jgi:hypothetical protein